MEGGLTSKMCVPCKKGTLPLSGDEIQVFFVELKEGWRVIEDRLLEKEYKFPDFQKALDFVNRIGKLAEEEGHHPDLYLSYGKLKVQLWTHKINGLSESDFIMAAKCDLISS